MGDCCEETCDTEFSFYPCGANQPYTCVNPKYSGAGETRARVRTGPSDSTVVNPKDSSYYLQEGFESNTFDHDRWKWMGGDAEWEIETGPTIEGRRYAEARTEFIIDDVGTAVLTLAVDSPRGGTVSYSIQALIQAPFEDVSVKVDNAVVSVDVRAVPEWTARQVEVGAGPHTVSWMHRKNPSDASEDELAVGTPNLGITRLDDVVFLPH